MTFGEAVETAEFYRPIAKFAFYDAGKLYLLLAPYAASHHIAHVLNEDGTPETILHGAFRTLAVISTTELEERGATLIYGDLTLTVEFIQQNEGTRP